MVVLFFRSEGPGGPQPPQPAQQSKRLQQTQAQVDEVCQTDTLNCGEPRARVFFGWLGGSGGWGGEGGGEGAKMRNTYDS